MSSDAYSAPSASVRILVLGGGDVGSAVAHLLFRKGLRLLIAERQRSSHARRGMAFTDVLFDGRAVLEGVAAQFAPDIATIDACWKAGECIPVATLPESLLVAAIRFDVVVDATMRREDVRADLRELAPCTIGLGPGYTPGVNCHVAIETQWGEAMGQVLRDSSAAMRAGGPRALDGVTRERFVPAPASGIWRTAATLGQPVQAGDLVGHLAGEPVRAPISGHLRGLARDGVEVMTNQRVVEVDPRQSPQIAGLGERPLAIARGVATALDSFLPAADRSR